MIQLFKQIWKTGTVTMKESVDLPPKHVRGKPMVEDKWHIEQVEIVGNQLRERIRQVLGQSLHIRHLDSGSCNGCDWEINTLLNPIYDIQRFGIDFVASPRHADMLLVTGGVTRHLEEAVKKTYEAMADPKIVLAIGSCACGGSMAGENYAHLGGVDKLFPVYAYVPGCPPRPQAIMDGILIALDRWEQKRYKL